MRVAKGRLCRLAAAAVILPSLVMPNIKAQAIEAGFYYGSAFSSCYMYEDADSSSEKIAFLDEGAICRVLDEEGNYLRVFSGGYTGYIRASVLDSSTETMEEVTSKIGVSADTDINIYSEASTSSAIIAERLEGATEAVCTDKEKDGWYYIEFRADSNGDMEYGWVKEDDVTPARIVLDAEPYLGEPDNEGIIIADSEDFILEEADRLREKAKDLAGKLTEKDEEEEAPVQQKPRVENIKPGVLNRQNGTVMGPSGKETYYNLNMSGVVKIMRRQGFSEEEYPYWVRVDGCKMLGPYIMCAADLALRPRGSLVESSLGTCIVADTGDFIYANPTQIDIAVDW